MSWTLKPDLPGGHYPTAAELEAITDQIDALTAPDWLDYTTAPSGGSAFQWSALSGNPAIGNGTQVAKYRRPPGTDQIDVFFEIAMGTTTTFGTGVYFVSSPFTMHSDMVGVAIGTVYSLNNAVQDYSAILKAETTTTIRMVVPAGGSWSPTVPHTFGSSDTIAGSFTFQPA